MIDYAENCKAAATAQGLDPLTAALDAAGVEYVMEQTGGYCMAVTVRDTANDRTWAVVKDGTGASPWLLGEYRGDAWTESGESSSDSMHTLGSVVAVLAAAQSESFTLIDGDAYLWVWMPAHGAWTCAKHLDDDSDEFSTSNPQNSVYRGFEAWERIARNHGLDSDA